MARDYKSALTVNGDPVLTNTSASSISNKIVDNTNVVTLKSDGLTLQDATDTTKQATFALSGITTATTRTLSLPNGNTSLVGTSTTQTLTGKTISGASNTLSNIAQSSVTNLTTDLAGKAATSHTHVVGDISATGTPSSTTYLRGDGSWAALAGGGNAQTDNPLSQFAATTSAQLAGVLTDETGTGAAVFAGSPALTGIPTAPTASLANNSTQLATTAYVDASVVQYKDENYYKNTGTTSYERWYQAGRVNGVASTTASYSINILRAIPVVWGRTSTIDRIGFNVTVLAASGTGRVGIYSNTSNTNLYPSALIIDAGEVSTNTTGLKSATVSQSLTAGNLYWFVVSLGVAAPTLGALSVGSIGSLLGTDNTGIGTMGTFIQVSSTYGALPGTFPASATISTGGAPIITYRVA